MLLHSAITQSLILLKYKRAAQELVQHVRLTYCIYLSDRKIVNYSNESIKNSTVTYLLLQAGDVHPNPGTTNIEFYICSINVRSLLAGVDLDRHVATQYSKLDEIKASIIEMFHPIILCLNETWLDENICDADIELQNYRVFRKDRNRHGGGVLICGK